MSIDSYKPNSFEAQKLELEQKTREAFAEFGVDISKSDILSKSKEDLEDFRNPWAPDRRAYGALPNFGKRDEIMSRFPEEAEYFKKHYTPGEKGRPAWMDPSYAEGVVLFEMKFDEPLSSFCEDILAHYPDLGKKGKEISIFGLSGSGKSTVTETINKKFGSDIVIMDSDTVRFNLLAKMVKEVEEKGGADLDEIRNHLMHNNISGPLYFATNYVAKELKERGYTVIESSTQPTSGADVTIYVEHPDGIDPSEIIGDEEKQKEVAGMLYKRTEARVDGPDDYDWDNAETVTDFNNMESVSVQVPQRVHEIFVKNVGQTLKDSGDFINRLHNIQADDTNEREEMISAELDRILG